VNDRVRHRGRRGVRVQGDPGDIRIGKVCSTLNILPCRRAAYPCETRAAGVDVDTMDSQERRWIAGISVGHILPLVDERVAVGIAGGAGGSVGRPAAAAEELRAPPVGDAVAHSVHGGSSDEAGLSVGAEAKRAADDQLDSVGTGEAVGVGQMGRDGVGNGAIAETPEVVGDVAGRGIGECDLQWRSSVCRHGSKGGNGRILNEARCDNNVGGDVHIGARVVGFAVTPTDETVADIGHCRDRRAAPAGSYSLRAYSTECAARSCMVSQRVGLNDRDVIRTGIRADAVRAGGNQAYGVRAGSRVSVDATGARGVGGRPVTKNPEAVRDQTSGSIGEGYGQRRNAIGRSA